MKMYLAIDEAPGISLLSYGSFFIVYQASGLGIFELFRLVSSV